jgi:hypothetical protein
MDHDPEGYAAHLKRWDGIGKWCRGIGAGLVIVGILVAVFVFAT